MKAALQSVFIGRGKKGERNRTYRAYMTYFLVSGFAGAAYFNT